MIVPTDNASQRTKNRIREHNLEEKYVRVQPPSRREERLFECTDEECNWVGWIPNNDFAVKETV